MTTADHGTMAGMEWMRRLRIWSGPPLALQIMGLMLGVLIIAQLVTLALTVLLPPAPQQQYNLSDIARLLAVRGAGRADLDGLQRQVQNGAPSPGRPGWLTSERSRQDLARMLGENVEDVRLYFFTPLPFAGAAATPSRLIERTVPERAAANTERPRRLEEGGFVRVQATPSFPGGGFPGGFPGGGFPGAATTGFPAAAFPNAMISAGHSLPGGFPVTIVPGALAVPIRPDLTAVGPLTASRSPIPSGTVLPQTTLVPSHGDPGAAVQSVVPSATSALTVVRGVTLPFDAVAGVAGGPTRLVSAGPIFPGNLPVPPQILLPHATAPAVPERKIQIVRPLVASAPESPIHSAPLVGVTAPQAVPAAPFVPPSQQSHPAPRPSLAPEVPIAQQQQRGLFGLAPVPFVEGDFVAALHLANGQWAVVQPVPEPFPNSWQRRVLLWFLLSFALVAPLGWLFARRLVHPISGFALAAEALGRDPTASILALEGPAEVGRAAHAFNRMQSRLRSFVDDRTAMVGAISHDLRTPLTRLRFRIEDVPDEQREGMLAEVDEMEQMISSVLAFIRDASEPGSRERLDLRSIVEDVVEDAVFVGKPVTLEQGERAPVEVDPLGIRRLLGNLVENAVKYGDTARVRLFTDRQEVVAEVRDNGPGLPDEELERVFQPFYRAPAARASNKLGSGLGLAVCRSIARAHGGDVQLMRGEHGLVAQVRLPLAYGMADG